MSKLKIIQNNNNLAIAYYRYSSHAQNEASIDQQREQAQRYAEAHGLKIIKEYEDNRYVNITFNSPEYE
ncbi:MAG: recombinase family protein [Ruminococcus sp.]|nr:recombinase family protein [Ruminococcus sp.]